MIDGNGDGGDSSGNDKDNDNHNNGKDDNKNGDVADYNIDNDGDNVFIVEDDHDNKDALMTSSMG